MSAVDEEDNSTIHRGSGNFLADQGVPNPDEFRVQALLGNRIALILEDRKQTAIAGIDEAALGHIVAGRSYRVDVWTLMKALLALGCDIDVGVSQPKEGVGVALVSVDDDDQAAAASSTRSCVGFEPR